MQKWSVAWILFWVLGAFVFPAAADEELKTLLDRLLAPPQIKTTTGFTAKVLVPPGQLYDPLQMLVHESLVWLNDDGKEEKDQGGRLLSVDRSGKVTVLVDADKLLPVVGFDVAPQGFGEFGGQIFTSAPSHVGQAGVMENSIIQRIDPQDHAAASLFCTLRELGEKQFSGFAGDGRFGLAGSPFANKFYVPTALNYTIYQVTADGQCTPFVTFDRERVGMSNGMVFTPDGQALLLTVIRGNFSAPMGSAIVRVRPDGTVEDKPLVEAKGMLTAMAFAPEAFGTYGGQLFVTDVGDIEFPVPQTQRLAADGKVYRVTPEGTLTLVASGFVNPFGLRFIGNTLWVSDVNGDFMLGKRELPDGFIVEIERQKSENER